MAVLLLVACIGLVVETRSAEPEQTATERALAESAASAQSLAAAAGVLARNASPEDAAAYSRLSNILSLHWSALHLPEDGSVQPPPVSPSGDAPSPAPPTAEPPSAQSLLDDLADSYTGALQAALTVEPGPARLLASVGTAQWLQARTLAANEDLSPPAAPVPAATNDDDEPACPPESTAQPDPGLEGARTAVLAEHRAAYAYEVVAARAAAPEPYLARMAEHEVAAGTGAAVLEQQCAAEPLPAVAYALDAGFLTAPDAALGEFESGLVGTYADLVGVSAPGPVRNWAVQQLLASVQHVAALPAEEPLPPEAAAFPGIDESSRPKLPQTSR